jgi:prepilin-type N-terminal cleavage/methylation domain-containing protein
MKKHGFTLIELMIVVLIVGILAAILAPMMMAHLEKARWSEAKAGCGALATAIRATYAEYGEEGPPAGGFPTDPIAYLEEADLRGKYFSIGDYTITITLTPANTEYPIQYTVSVGPPTDSTVTVVWRKAGYKLDWTGKWTELSGT